MNIDDDKDKNQSSKKVAEENKDKKPKEQEGGHKSKKVEEKENGHKLKNETRDQIIQEKEKRENDTSRPLRNGSLKEIKKDE